MEVADHLGELAAQALSQEGDKHGRVRRLQGGQRHNHNGVHGLGREEVVVVDAVVVREDLRP